MPVNGIEGLERIGDPAVVDNIRELTRRFVTDVAPQKVFLFGSFANGAYTEDSDFDFYLVIDDERSVGEATDEAYTSVRHVKKRPVDIVVGTQTRFENKSRSSHSMMVEGEVRKNGILLYDRMNSKAGGAWL